MTSVHENRRTVLTLKFLGEQSGGVQQFVGNFYLPDEQWRVGQMKRLSLEPGGTTKGLLLVT